MSTSSLGSGDVSVRADTDIRDFSRVVTIDGPAGTGKSSVSRQLARRLDGDYLDTGAMYRTATLAVLRAGVSPDDAQAVESVVASVEIDVCTDNDGQTVAMLDGEDVSAEIRENDVTRSVSAVSAVGAVRDKLVARQRELAAGHLIVAEGRDVGTVVFPGAAAKIYLTATPAARAQRRHRQDQRAGRDSDYATVLADVERRDHLDSTRAISPLRPAEDAVTVDTSDMTIDEVIDRLESLVRKRIGVAS
ncbi:(d)CMP kinase [Gordonia jinhuaensis]|uniref:Cytidylate kinase n=1 Tax=Gordonia jinhuaensis TaxID=1517702 RepID=A0A916X0Y6_9ACTN|nr:cytidylate kinase [Gordonia jinhuaensis]